jgi:glutamate-1-semialdehyde aminotransferase
LTKGVHVIHGGGGLSLSHSDKDLEKIFKATREVAKEMKNTA